MFQITLGMLKLKEPYFQNLENSAQIFNSLSDIPGDIDDVDTLFEASMSVGGVSKHIFPRMKLLEINRNNFQFGIVAEQNRDRNTSSPTFGLLDGRSRWTSGQSGSNIESTETTIGSASGEKNEIDDSGVAVRQRW